MTKCDDCDKSAEWLVYAAYTTNDMTVHPTLKRYPAPMIRACNTHLIGRMWSDLQRPGATGQFVVRPA